MTYLKILTGILVFALFSTLSTTEAQVPDYNRKGIEIGSVNDITFKMGLHSVGRFQALSQSNVQVWNGSAWIVPTDLSTGMQTSFANLEFMIHIGDDIDVFFDGLLATQRHPTQWWGHQGYMYIRQMPESSVLSALNPLFAFIDIKAGNFYANYGEHQFTRTLNADAHRNLLIGNPVVSPLGVEPGMEIYHKGNGYGLMIGGGIGAPEQDFHEARKYSYRGKLWLDMFDGVYVSGSYYNVEHDPGIARGTNMFRRERLGSSYGAVWNLNNDNSGAGEGPGSVRPGDGRTLSTWEANAILTLFDGNKLSGYFGSGTGSGANPSNQPKGDEEWTYFGVEASQYLNDDIFLAARYSNIDYSKFLTTDNTGNVFRMQFGGGLWITENILMKAEYVYQKAEGFNAGTYGVANSVDVGIEPEFKGFILEVAVSF